MKKMFSIIILLIMLIGVVGCARQVSSWTEMVGPGRIDTISDDAIELSLNVDSDTPTQFKRLTKAEKINYVSYWGNFMTIKFRDKTGITDLSEAVEVKVVKKPEKGSLYRRFDFYFKDGNKFTITIGGVRGEESMYQSYSK